CSVILSAMGSGRTIDLEESESIGVVYKISTEGIIFVFTPGYFPDPYIDQRLTPPENRYALGDFVALQTGEGSAVRSHKKTEPVLRVEVDGDRILVETQISFFPSTGQYGMCVEALTGNAAWSPDFNIVLCEADVISQPRRNHMYTAWVQR
uniref:Uncharacterized protein n=1 Tax=Parascaris univalens TaxID=6257 RepID=A0A914ZFU2_PARUN